MNRRTFLTALICSPAILAATKKKLLEPPGPIELPVIRPSDFQDTSNPKRWIMVSNPTGDERFERQYFERQARLHDEIYSGKSKNRMWMIDWEDITWGPAPPYDPSKPEFSS